MLRDIITSEAFDSCVQEERKLVFSHIISIMENYGQYSSTFLSYQTHEQGGTEFTPKIRTDSNNSHIDISLTMHYSSVTHTFRWYYDLSPKEIKKIECELKNWFEDYYKIKPKLLKNFFPELYIS